MSILTANQRERLSGKELARYGILVSRWVREIITVQERKELQSLKDRAAKP